MSLVIGFFQFDTKTPTMLKNYFKIAFRILARNRAFAVINTFGLGLGISACLLIFTVITYELSFDKSLPGRDRIFRVVTELQNPGSQINHIATVPGPAADIIRSSVSGLETVALFYSFDPKVAIPVGNKIVRRFFPAPQGGQGASIILTEGQYFQIFKYQWLAGDPATALSEPLRVVISENEAHKYFGQLPPEEVMGREIIYDDSIRVKVTGIVKDWKTATDFKFRDFISYSTVFHSFLEHRGNWNNWGGWMGNSQVFVKLEEHSSAGQIDPQFSKIVKEHLRLQPGTEARFFLQPIRDIHFNGDFQDSYSRKAHLPTLYGLMAIAAFILVIAVFNFINLSTAQSIQRAKEIGIRKVFGSSRRNIVVQFLCEIFLLVLTATILSLVIMKPLIYLFHDLLPPGITLSFYSPTTILFLALLVLITSLLAGFYPAKVLSGYLPVISLKGEGGRQVSQGGNLRKAMIVFQFTLSLVFIIATLVTGNQVRFMLNQDMAFAKDAVINLNTDRNYPKANVDLLTDRLKGLAAVQMTSRNQGPPADEFLSRTTISYNGTDVMTQVLGADENYVPLYQLKIIAGRNITHSDTVREFLISETCARGLGFKKPEDAIGKMVDFGFSDGADGVKHPIVGVVADFHSESLHDPMMPITIATQYGRTVSVKLSPKSLHPEDFQSAMTEMGKAWKTVYPNEPFEYKILDDQIAKFYDSYRKTNQIMNTAMFIAIFISCMGLFGLAAFTAGQRRKEIGVRKVLGASVTGIISMLSKDFLKLVLLSLALASPIAWYFMKNWLDGFAFRINLSLWIFMLAGSIALIIALATIIFQAIKAAIESPVKSLRSE
jgi:putative ABC transport system permease protein